MRTSLERRTSLWFLWIVSLLFAIDVHAAPTEGPKVVRVGWHESAFNQKDSLGRRSGYSYEYQRRIAAYTGWTYEYVEASWSELLDMLQRGEIDLLSNVTPTSQRIGHMLFSKYDMGKEDYYIVTLKNNKLIKPEQPSTLKDMRIGVNKNGLQADILHSWLQEQKIPVKVEENYHSDEDYLQDLNEGRIDALACINTSSTLLQHQCIPMFYIGSYPINFGISNNRPDLKEDLDEAMEKINSRGIYNLYLQSADANFLFTDEEKEWLHQHPTLRIGYRNNYLPFCAQSDTSDQAEGVMGDFVDKINLTLKEFGMQVETKPYASFKDAADAMERGEVDIAFPCGMTAYETEQAHLLTTEPLLKAPEIAIVRKDYNLHIDRPQRVAVNGNNLNYLTVVHAQYPHWQVMTYSNTEECLRQIADGNADLLLAGGYRMAVLYGFIEQLGLKTVATGGDDILLSFAIPERENELFSIISRLMHSMTDSEIHTSLSKYSANTHSMSVMDFLHAHMLLVFITLVVVIGLFALLLIQSYRANRRANEANEAKTRFLFNMSHDIRTPMNAIIGYAALMKKELNNPAKSEDYLKKICSAGQYLLDLINNILEMSRIESGKLELDEHPHRVMDIFKDLSTVYADIMKEKGICFAWNTAIKTSAIYCDRMKVNEVMLNLLSNAYKYTSKGGLVRVTCEEIANPKPGYTTLVTRISDTGIGISEKFLPHLFEDFARERSVTDNKISGSGLGMSIVKRFVDLMQGTITVESELGKGTTFTVSAPFRIADESLLKSKEPLPATDSEASTDSFKGKRIMLTEDNELNAEIASEILTEYGFIITWAKDGQECIDRLSEAEAGTYCLILMDVQMPVMNGYEATQRIRQMSDPAKANIPIIAMTANAFAEDKKNALHAGMNAHVAKPIDVPLLMQTIGSFIQ